jgi:hypothetical protein
MNMKPPEILSLLEEASGTKLYERKKDAALKTLSKKEARLEEIDQVGRRGGPAPARPHPAPAGRRSSHVVKVALPEIRQAPGGWRQQPACAPGQGAQTGKEATGQQLQPGGVAAHARWVGGGAAAGRALSTEHCLDPVPACSS